MAAAKQLTMTETATKPTKPTKAGERYALARLGENQYAVLEIQQAEEPYYSVLVTKRTMDEVIAIVGTLRMVYGK